MDLNIIFYGREKNLEKILLELLSSEEECFLWVVTARALQEKDGEIELTRRNVYPSYAMISRGDSIKLQYPPLRYPDEPPYELDELDLERVKSAENLLFVQSRFLDMKTGDAVRVVSGPLHGLTGTVEEINDTTATIAVTIFGREIKLKVSLACLSRV